MKERTGFVSRYAPLWAVVAVMVVVFFTSTLPAIRSRRALVPVRNGKRARIESLKKEVRRLGNRIEALEKDPITVEGELRKRLGSAGREGEIVVDPARRPAGPAPEGPRD